MIILLTTLCILLLIAVAFCLSHIKLINKELEEISKEQISQNEDIRNLITSYFNLIKVITDAAKKEEETKKPSFFNIKGEA
jgi:hypothetical protein